MAVVSWWSDSKSDQSSPEGAFGALARAFGPFDQLQTHNGWIERGGLKANFVGPSSIFFIPERGFTSGTHGPM